MSNSAVKLATLIIQQYEGARLRAYADTGGIPTIGFGHTKGVKLGDVITMEQAQEWFEEDLAHLVSAVEGKSDIEAGALISFTYQCGLGALQKVLSGEAKLDNFIRDKRGNVLVGMQMRRRFEQTLIDISKEVISGPQV